MEKISRKRFPRQIQKIMCCNISNPTKWECTSVYFYDMKVSYSSEIRTNDVNDIVIKSNNINMFNCRKGYLVSLNEDAQHCPYAKKKRKRSNNDMDVMMLMILLNYLIL